MHLHGFLEQMTSRCLVSVRRASYVLPGRPKIHLVFFTPLATTLLLILGRTVLDARYLPHLPRQTCVHHHCSGCLCFARSSLAPWHWFLYPLGVSCPPWPVLSLALTVLDLCSYTLCTLLGVRITVKMPLVQIYRACPRFPTHSVQLLFLVYTR